MERVDALGLIQRGRVTVAGRVRRANVWTKTGDLVSINGHGLEDLANTSYVAHKPLGCLLKKEDPLGWRPTYVSLMPDPTMPVCPAGRIGSQSSGMLVLTNQRQLIWALEGPWLPATFRARLRAPLQQMQIRAMQNGMSLRGQPIGLSVLKLEVEEPASPSPVLHVTLGGGGDVSDLQHLLVAAGAPAATGICCVRVGPLSVETPELPPGASRMLGPEELKEIVEAAKVAFETEAE
eukprot:gnl/MRDRNA2_/MRDRNA2_50566_c0_seq2.p1 gnl/MRDRNA2_/MRDRNA2_50566_c0~~gnl/MRDRNA2_/MRDRNA2_50566_c0_seq2.p1  ORF type:complete len:275 (+),score=54.66 gnl/MRDRNA2_/MRDRNA2_50566_c0_seq2:120-827(+)